MAAETCRKCGGVKRDEPPMTESEREAVKSGWDLGTFRFAVAEAKRVREQRAAAEPAPAPDLVGAICRARGVSDEREQSTDLVSAVRAAGGAAKGVTR